MNPLVRASPMLALAISGVLNGSGQLEFHESSLGQCEAKQSTQLVVVARTLAHRGNN